MKSPLKVLFICAKNQWRSPTAAAIYRNDARLSVQSAGLSQSSPTVISAKLLTWADLVLVMENEHTARIRDRFRGKIDLPKMVSLGIPDDYEFMNPELIGLLEAGVKEVLEDFLT